MGDIFIAFKQFQAGAKNGENIKPTKIPIKRKSLERKSSGVSNFNRATYSLAGGFVA